LEQFKSLLQKFGTKYPTSRRRPCRVQRISEAFKAGKKAKGERFELEI